MEVVIKSVGFILWGLFEGSDQVLNDWIVILMYGFKGDLGYIEENFLN